MINNLNQLDSTTFQNRVYDICIIGAGPAGLTIALNLPKYLNILLLEAGGMQRSDESQQVYQGTNTGHTYFDLEKSRSRFFGGSSNHWSGMCRPLDDHDFEKKAHVPLSGWPISYNDIQPYQQQAWQMLDLDKPDPYNVTPAWKDYLQDTEDFNNIEFWLSPPTRFRKKYRKAIQQSGNIDCYINANLTDMQLDEDLQNVKEVVFHNYKKTRFSASARHFVLATGGIENPRLLLNFNTQKSQGLANDSGFVGRCFVDHPHYRIGEFVFADDALENLRAAKPDGYLQKQFVAPNKDFIERERCLNFSVRIEPYRFKLADRRQGSTMWQQIKRASCRTEWTWNLYKELTDKPDSCFDGKVKIASDQTPNPNSRIILGDTTDQFGLRHSSLHWQLGLMEKHTMRVAAFAVGQLFIDRELGRLKIPDWLLADDSFFPGFPQQVGGHHHIGTTRMSGNPKEGVVDKNLRAHSVNNLFITGSSVFTTSGHTNPTLSIVQFSLRLANHLKSLYPVAL